MFLQSNEQGADCVLYVALSPDVEKDAGKYFQNCRTYCTNSQVTNTTVHKKLSEASCKATGWQDTLSTGNRARSSPSRKNAPAIVITSDGAESTSRKGKVTKDDLENEGDQRQMKPGVVTAGSSVGADIPTKVGGSE